MKKKSYLFSVLVLFVILSAGCNRIGKPLDFDYGKVENNKYTNSYFGCEMSIPKEWIVQTKEQMESLTEEGTDLVAGDDAKTKALLKASEIRSANLLAVFKYERGAAVDFNPNLMVVAENVSSFPGTKTGSDYLFQARKLLTQSQLQYDYIDSVFKKEQINNTEFYTMNASVTSMDIEINQVYYSAIINGFSFNIILTYDNAEHKQELISVVNTLKFE